MKTLIILLLLFSGCATYLHEDSLYVTRKYCGTFDTLCIEKKDVKIITSEQYFYIHGRVALNIPPRARCYVKYIRETLPDSYGSSVWILYFTWDGTEDLYMIKQNYITGQILR